MIHLIISSIIQKLKKDMDIIILKYYYSYNIQTTSEADIITYWDWKKENILIIIIFKKMQKEIIIVNYFVLMKILK